MRKILKLLAKINMKTIYFNIKYLPFNQAIKLPILISRRVYLRKTSGAIIILHPIKPGLIKIGYGDIGIFDDKHSRSIWEVSGKVIFKGKANIGHGSKISVGNNGILQLGNNFAISAESSIVAFSKVEFGDNCLLSWDVLVMDTDFHLIKDEKGNIINQPQPIIFGNNVWVGCRNLILKGTKIPDNCVIAANSLVSKELTVKNSLYAGNPIKLLKENIRWEK